jgi:UDP-N-acetylmuramate-alanine ligase
VLVLLPSYHVAGREKADTRFTAKRLSEEIKRKYPTRSVYYLENPKELKRFLIKNLPENGVVIMMGAGNIVNYTPSLLS